MKKTIFILLIYLLNSKSLVSQECNNQLDPFTNEPSSVFEYKPYNVRWLHMEIKKDKRILEFRAVERGAMVYTIPKASEVLIKLENNEILKFTTLGDVSSNVGTAGASGATITYSEYYLKMEVTVEQLQKLAASKVINMRYPDLHGGTMDDKTGDMRKGFRKAFIKGAKCLLGMK